MATQVLRGVRRVLSVAVASIIVVVALVFLFAWIALRIPWEVPDRGAVTGPSEIVDSTGVVLARFDSEVDRRLVAIGDIAPVAQQAVIASEDARFYEHDGVDPPSLLRAIASNLRTDGITQGGSTLTQQYVKNAFLTPERTITRKIREAVISIALERQMDKDEILEAYLNEVYFGEGAYGIEAAALTYFGVNASQLDPAESATLAQLLPGPSTRNPRADRDGATDRRNALLDRMVALGDITRDEADRWKRRPMLVLPRDPTVRREPFIVDHVRAQIIAAYGEDALLTGRLTIETTIDLEAQRQLEQAVQTQLPQQPEPYQDIDAGAAVVDPETGNIIALYGGRDHARNQVNLATQQPAKQPGSTFKPFVYIAALQQGIDPLETYRAPGSVLPEDCEPLADGTNPFKEPVANSDGRGRGSMTISSALSNSVNTVFVQLGCDVGAQAVVDTMTLMGVRNRIAADPLNSIGAGTTGPTPLDMASAYATLANDGLACPARSILRVSGPDGELTVPDEVTTTLGQEPRARRLTEEELELRDPELAELDQGRCRQVLDPDIARTTIEALELVVAETTATRAQLGIPQAGKTGTTDGPTNAWFAGFTPALSMTVWVGNPYGEQELRGIQGFDRVFGGTIPALIWRDAAAMLLADVAPTDFLEPGELTDDETEGVRVGPARGRSRPTPRATPTPSNSEIDLRPDSLLSESESASEEDAGEREDPDDPASPEPDEPGDGPSATPTDGGTGGSPPPDGGSEEPSDGGSDGDGEGEGDDGCVLIFGDC